MAASLLFGAALATPAAAQAPASPFSAPTEAWAGVDAMRDTWLIYSGATLAPFSANLYSDGWRLRVGGGYGQYSYEASHPVAQPCGTAGTLACQYEQQKYIVDRSYAEALIGYHMRLGDLTAKAFAGAAMSSHGHRTDDPTSKLDGTEYGVKGALELWLDFASNAWSSLDASYSTAHEEASARWRTGLVVVPRLSIGPELKVDRNIDADDGWTSRAGLFGRYQWEGGEFSLASGVVRQDARYDSAYGPYGTLNVLLQY